MNRFEDAILKKLMRVIQSKNSWGKNELLHLIGELAVEQISEIKPLRVTPAPAKPALKPILSTEPQLTPKPRKISIDDLPPF